MSSNLPPATPQLMEELLNQALQPNSDVVRQAGEAIGKYLNNSSTTPILLELIQKSSYPHIRQYAAVLMRKKILKHFGRLKQDVQEHIKNTLLDILVTEQMAVVRKSVSELIGSLAKLCIPAGQWNQLLEFLLKCSQSPQMEHRELSLVLFESLTENIEKSMKQHFNTLIGIFANGLKDNEQKVRLAALKAVASLVQMMSEDQEVMAFAALVPLIVNVINHCLSNGLDDEAIAAFEIFDDLIELPMPVVSTFIPDLIRFVLQVSANKKISNNARRQALNIVEWTATYKPKTLAKNDLIAPIFQVIFPMCGESDVKEEDDDDEQISSHKFAAQLIDTIALNVSSKHVLAPAMEYIKQYVVSPNPALRRAGFIALTVLSEGCAIDMSEENMLNPTLQIIYQAFQDPDKGVREAACLALDQFSTHMQPEISKHYQSILPLLFQALNDPTDEVRIGVCYALEAFCQRLGSEILPYLEQLLTKLVELLRVGSLRVQEIAISAISATAAAAGKGFLPFFEALIGIMRSAMNSTDETIMLIRCKATECVGLIASAVGRDVFRPYLKEFMTLAVNGCMLEDNELREFTYSFFSSMAETFKALSRNTQITFYQEEFAEMLPTVVPLLFASCQSTEGVEEFILDGEEEGTDAQFQDEDDEDEEGGTRNITVRTAFLDEKAAACQCIGVIAEHCGPHFFRYVEDAVKIFSVLVNYFHDYVRQTVLTSYYQLILCVRESCPVVNPYINPGDTNNTGLKQDHSEQTKMIIDQVIPLYLHAIENDEDKTTVACGLENFEKVIKTFGVYPLSLVNMPRIIAVMVQVLRKQVVCQRHEVDDDEEDQDLDIQIIDQTGDCLVSMSRVYGPLFEPYFHAVYLHILKYYNQKTKAESYRTIAIGVLAEISKSLGAACSKYLEQLIPVALKATTDSDPTVRSNAAYFLGILLLNGGNQSVQYYNQALMSLANLFNDNAVPNIIDNAASAICKMITSNPNSVPINQVLPALLRVLPLKKDFEENRPVFSCLFMLCRGSHPEVANNFGAMIKVFAQSLGSPNIEQDIQNEIVAILKTFSAQMNSAMSSLTPEEIQNLQKFLN